MSEPAFEVIPLGVGNYFSTFRYCTSLLLCAGGRKVLVDCPDPFFRMTAEAARASGRVLDVEDFDDVVLTHLHGDHCNGLEGFGFWKRFVSRKKARPRLHTSREVASVVWNKLAPAMASSVLPPLGMDDHFGLEDYFEPRVFEIGSTIEVAGIRLETRRTLHTIPTFGFRAEFAGRRFGYSCDTIFDPAMIEFLSPCDLIFHECDRSFIHTRQEDLETLPEAIRRKLRLVHLNDAFAGSELLEPAEAGRIYAV